MGSVFRCVLEHAPLQPSRGAFIGKTVNVCTFDAVVLGLDRQMRQSASSYLAIVWWCHQLWSQ